MYKKLSRDFPECACYRLWQLDTLLLSTLDNFAPKVLKCEPLYIMYSQKFYKAQKFSSYNPMKIIYKFVGHIIYSETSDKGHFERVRTLPNKEEHTLYRKSPLKEDNLSTKEKNGWSQRCPLLRSSTIAFHKRKFWALGISSYKVRISAEYRTL